MSDVVSQPVSAEAAIRQRAITEKVLVMIDLQHCGNAKLLLQTINLWASVSMSQITITLGVLTQKGFIEPYECPAGSYFYTTDKGTAEAGRLKKKTTTFTRPLDQE
jgi:hypothetical protein